MQKNKKLLSEKVLLLDGGMGTLLQNNKIQEEPEGPNEYLVLNNPEIIKDIHRQYLEAGADIIETNSFGGGPIVLKEYNLAEKTFIINMTAAKIARELADRYTSLNPTKPRFVAGSMGPTNKSISLLAHQVTFAELIENYYQHAKGLAAGGVDYFLLETCNDTRTIKAGFLGIEKLLAELKMDIPVAVSVTLEASNTLLAGQSIDALIISLLHKELLYLGLNCATGPELMYPALEILKRNSPFPVACVPNAGIPDESGNYRDTPQSMSLILEKYIDEGLVDIIGGCCGTTPDHIRAFNKIIQHKKPIIRKKDRVSKLSGIDPLEISSDIVPVLVGERANVIGSAKFRKLIEKEDFEMAAELAKAQIKTGASIVDICFASTERNELADMKIFLEKAINKIRVPFMIDTTNIEVAELALQFMQGKAIINSINLEDGGVRFDQVAKLANSYGAALVVGAIDDDPVEPMAKTAQQKMKVFRKAHQLLTTKYNFKEEDIYFDPLVFPCITAIQENAILAQETIDAITLVKKEFPNAKTVLGISNVSFGSPAIIRETINSVFLYRCVKAGLDLAIVNAEKIKRYANLSSEEINWASDLLLQRDHSAINKLVEFYGTEKKEIKIESSSLELSLEEKIARSIIDGIKVNLITDLQELLITKTPVEIINLTLMVAMSEVGRLFRENKLIVTEVLQSAEVMKAAIKFLEQFIDSDKIVKGKVMLATVKGDVHDIGKNLVEIIFSSNGYKIIDLGTKVPAEVIVAAIKKDRPDMIGLSGLLIKSAEEMISIVKMLKNESIDIPVLIGGAAITAKFVETKLAPNYYAGKIYYAGDAMEGLQLANNIIDARFKQ